MNKSNVYSWIKKTADAVDNFCEVLEMDELFWFMEKKPKTQTRENTYVITLVSRFPRQIVGFDAAGDKSPERVQRIVDGAPEASRYCTDGWFGCVDVIYPGRHIRNVRDKSDAYTAEGINADLRHYIPILARRSGCFPRKLETLRAVLEVFVDAYNQFGRAKYIYRQRRNKGGFPSRL